MANLADSRSQWEGGVAICSPNRCNCLTPGDLFSRQVRLSTERRSEGSSGEVAKDRTAVSIPDSNYRIVQMEVVIAALRMVAIQEYVLDLADLLMPPTCCMSTTSANL